VPAQKININTFIEQFEILRNQLNTYLEGDCNRGVYMNGYDCVTGAFLSPDAFIRNPPDLIGQLVLYVYDFYYLVLILKKYTSTCKNYCKYICQTPSGLSFSQISNLYKSIIYGVSRNPTIATDLYNDPFRFNDTKILYLQDVFASLDKYDLDPSVVAADDDFLEFERPGAVTIVLDPPMPIMPPMPIDPIINPVADLRMP